MPDEGTGMMDETRIRVVDVVNRTGLDNTYWTRILDQEGDALRKKLGFEYGRKTFPAVAMAFFEFVASERSQGNKKATPRGALALYEQWISSIQVGPTFTTPVDASGELVALPPPSEELTPANAGDGAPSAGQGQPVDLLAHLVREATSQAVQQVAVLALPVPAQRLLTIAEVAQKLQLSRDWIRKHVPSVELPGTRSRRWREADVDRFIASLGAR